MKIFATFTTFYNEYYISTRVSFFNNSACSIEQMIMLLPWSNI